MPTRNGPKTEVRPCHSSWLMEFTRLDGNGLNDTAIAEPPWYIVRYSGMFWGKGDWSYIWYNYGGPPKVFLTRKQAEVEARAFRKQYGGGKQCGNGPLVVEVVKIEVAI